MRLETQISHSLPPLTPPQFLACAPCLCIDNVLGNRVILLGLGRRFYSAPFPARQAILDGVIGEGCCRLSEGHSCLAAFLVQWLGTRRCLRCDCMAVWKGVNKVAEVKERFQKRSFYFELVNSLTSNVGGIRQLWENCQNPWREEVACQLSLPCPALQLCQGPAVIQPSRELGCSGVKREWETFFDWPW